MTTERLRLPTGSLALVLLAAALLLGAPARAADPADLEPVTDVSIDPLGARRAVPRALRVRFTAFGRQFDLLLRAVPGDDPALYRGRVRRAPGSRAWLAVRDGVLDGVIATREGAFGVAPAARFGRGTDGTVAYPLPAAASSVAPGAPAGPATDAQTATATGGSAVGSAPLASASGSGARVAPAETAPDAAAAISAAAAQALVSVNKNAQAAIGQSDLVSNVLNQPAANGIFFPFDIARDPSVAQTRFFVADTLNSRVLGFECAGAGCQPTTFGSATTVFGQPDFGSFQQNGGVSGSVQPTTMNFPQGVAVDAAGTLYVADTSNNRVLIFLTPWADAVADRVIGQPNLTASGAGSGLNQLRGPVGVFVDTTGALWVADTANNRVLKFASTTTGASAAFAVGSGGGPSATTLSGPRDVLLDGGGNLWVADTGFSRVLRYASPITAGKAASIVFGHNGSFTNGAANQTGVNADGLGFPQKLELDGSGRLWVADTGNQRVLVYDTPLTSQTANRVFGQADRNQTPTFATNVRDAPDGFPNAAGFWGPHGLAFDAAGALWVCDRDNSRILGFNSPTGAAPAAIIADRALGKATFVDASVNIPSATRMNNPVGIGVDTSVSPNRLWIADIGNNRVLGYDSTADLVNNRAANRVLGQTSFSAGPTNGGINGPLQNAVTAVGSTASLFFPVDVAVDSLGGVYVADNSNNRVLHFVNPFAGDTAADRVFGQTNFANRNPNFQYGTAQSMAGIGGVSVGPGNDLWVADTVDNRVIRFANAPAAPTTNASANLILGQANFVALSTFPPYAPGCAANRMTSPQSVHAAPSGRVYVADAGNHRVLVFGGPFTNGMSASAVFGQASFTACSANRGGAPSAASLFDPRGIHEDSAGNVFIADHGNHRVLVYYTPFNGGDMVADDVIGQPNFTSTAVPAPRPDTMSSPADVVMDASERLLVADRENSRVLRYAVNAGPAVLLDPPASPIVVGDFLALTGSGFTGGSVVKLYIATASGTVAFGPYTPSTVNSGVLYIFVPPDVPLGAGFGAVQVINTDQGYIESNAQVALIYGNAASNIPTITKINGVALRPPDVSVPTANVETVVAQGQLTTITGTGFNSPLVNLFSASGNVGPLAPASGWTSTQFQVRIPDATPTGPGSFQVVNNPYVGTVVSNAVSVPIGAVLSITSVAQTGSTVSVDGTGFSTLSVINLFNVQSGGGTNLGGFGPNGANVPLTIVSPNRFTFQVPAGAQTGAAYIEVLNPPFIAFSSSGNDPDGAFNIVAP